MACFVTIRIDVDEIDAHVHPAGADESGEPVARVGYERQDTIADVLRDFCDLIELEGIRPGPLYDHRSDDKPAVGFIEVHS